MNDTPAITVEHVRRSFRGMRHPALYDLSLSIPTGRIAALVGPNGAGKSTLIRCLMGYDRPDAGRVLVHGIDPRKERSRALLSVGYVPQGAALYRSLTARDHFAVAETYRRDFDTAFAIERVESAQVDVDRPVGHLSGGEQAQVSLALALATRASILILDEPLANLDPLARREFLTTLSLHVEATGCTVLLSSHIVTDVEQACDWLVVLSHGRLALTDSIASIRVRFSTITPSTGLSEQRASFVGLDGFPRLLVDRTEGSAAATLEEVVLGHLASVRGAERAR